MPIREAFHPNDLRQPVRAHSEAKAALSHAARRSALLFITDNNPGVHQPSMLIATKASPRPQVTLPTAADHIDGNARLALSTTFNRSVGVGSAQTMPLKIAASSAAKTDGENIRAQPRLTTTAAEPPA